MNVIKSMSCDFFNHSEYLSFFTEVSVGEIGLASEEVADKEVGAVTVIPEILLWNILFPKRVGRPLALQLNRSKQPSGTRSA